MSCASTVHTSPPCSCQILLRSGQERGGINWPLALRKLRHGELERLAQGRKGLKPRAELRCGVCSSRDTHRAFLREEPVDGVLGAGPRCPGTWRCGFTAGEPRFQGHPGGSWTSPPNRRVWLEHPCARPGLQGCQQRGVHAHSHPTIHAHATTRVCTDTLPSTYTLLHTCAHSHPPYHPYTRYYTHTPPHHSGTLYHTHTQTHSHPENCTYFTLPRGAGCQVKTEPSLMWVSSSLQGIEVIKVKESNCQSFRKEQKCNKPRRVTREWDLEGWPHPHALWAPCPCMLDVAVHLGPASLLSPPASRGDAATSEHGVGLGQGPAVTHFSAFCN